MALLQVILFLLLCAVALGWVARHFQFPYPIALVIGGGALGFVPRPLPESCGWHLPSFAPASHSTRCALRKAAVLR